MGLSGKIGGMGLVGGAIGWDWLVGLRSDWWEGLLNGIDVDEAVHMGAAGSGRSVHVTGT